MIWGKLTLGSNSGCMSVIDLLNIEVLYEFYYYMSNLISVSMEVIGVGFQ